MRYRILPRLAAMLVVGLLASACQQVTGTGDPTTAAVVNGQEIPIDTLEARLEQAKSANPQLAQQLEGDAEGSVADQVHAQILTGLVQGTLLRQGAEEEFGIEVTDADIQAEREAVVEQVGGEEAFEQIIEENELSDQDVEELLEEQTYSTKVSERLVEDLDVTDEEVRQFFEENAEARFGERVAARHILVETRGEAQRVLERLERGEDFERLARRLSTDPSAEENAGDLGEFGAGQMVPEFEEAAFGAEVGDVVGPVKTEFGWHVIEVTGKSPSQELPAVEEEIRAELQGSQEQQALPEWIREQAGEADVEVNPRFGDWDPGTGTVVAEDPLATEPPAGGGGVTEPPAGGGGATEAPTGP